MSLELQEQTRHRASEAIYAVDQANTIYGLVFVIFSEFGGFQNEKWYWKLQAQIRVSGLVDALDSDDDLLGTAFEEVSFRRLPRLLCISLVSSVEACLEDIAAIEIAARRKLPREEAEKEADKLMRGGPQDYLPRLSALGLVFVGEPRWQELREIVATRNILVHRGELVADERYVRQAGDLARVTSGGVIEVDNSYLIQSYIAVRRMLSDFVRPLAK